MIRPMARVRSPSTGASLFIPPDAEFGRRDGSDIHTPHPLVSGRHAKLSWRAGRWLLSDSSSTNGTFLDGRRVAADAPQPVRVGSRIGLGHVDTDWEVLDAGRPVAYATNLATREQVEADSDARIAIPGTDVVVCHQIETGWTVDRGGAVTPLGRDRTVRDAAGAWQITLPEVVETQMHVQPRFQLGRVTLGFRVSGSQEHVSIELREGDDVQVLKPLGPYVLLWQLAVARLEDTTGPEHDRGWVDLEALADFTGVQRKVADEYVRRNREYLEDADVAGARFLIEVRPGQRRIAIPADRLWIAGEDDAGPRPTR